MFKKIKNKSVVQTVVDSITKAIISGELKPRDKIPTEMELAESFGVGRNSIREAIKILVYYGILEIRRAEGTFVCDGFNKIMIDPMVYGVILHQSQDYVNLMELREMMEVGVMRLAIAKYNEEDIARLHDKLEDLRKEIEKGPENGAATSFMRPMKRFIRKSITATSQISTGIYAEPISLKRRRWTSRKRTSPE